MKLSGESLIAAAPAAVWAALIDPEVLRPLIPGCETMSGSPSTGYDIVAARRVAGAELRLKGRIDLRDPRPGEGALVVASGSAGGAGAASGEARISLSPRTGGTCLAWTVEARVEGAIARLPEFMLRLAAGKVAEGFVRRFKAVVEGREPPTPRRLTGRLAG